MNKIARELIKISKYIEIMQSGEQIRNILASTYRFADQITKQVPDGGDAQKSIEETVTAIEKQKDLSKKQQLIDKLQKKINTTQQLLRQIQRVRQAMVQDVKDWGACLQYIYELFCGNNNKAFNGVQNALKNSKYFKPVAKKLEDAFKKVKTQVAKYNIKKMSFKEFKELVDDKQSGYMDNLIDPFVQMYNGYMDQFEALQKEYKDVIKQWQPKTQDIKQEVEQVVQKAETTEQKSETTQNETTEQKTETKTEQTNTSKEEKNQAVRKINQRQNFK